MTTTKATTLGNELAVLKQDGQGRVRTTAVRREQLLDEFERSGLSGPKFAALAGIKYQTFATWVQKRKRRSGLMAGGKAPEPAAASVKWVEAMVERPAVSASGTVLVLQLPGGVRVEVSDERQAVLAAMVVRALEEPC